MDYSPHHIIGEVVHVRSRNDAESHGFSHCSQRSPVDSFAVKLVFEREYPLVEPSVERQILAVSPHQAHRRMPVRVIESRHEHLALAVICLKESFLVFRRNTVNVNDAVAVGAYIHVLAVFEILINKSDILEEHSATPLSSST